MTRTPNNQPVDIRHEDWARAFIQFQPGRTDEEKEAWSANPHRRFHCIFCGRHGEAEDFLVDVGGHEVFGCPQCREYKGMAPCIPGKCEWGE